MNSRVMSRLKKLELEWARRKQLDPGREAWVVLGDCDGGETHLEMSGSYRGRCRFQEKPGPGPQLRDFGTFAVVMTVTQAEDGA
jgi:hypothetical protein